MRNVALVQPLPTLVYADCETEYSEFPSLGLARVAGVLRRADCDIKSIIYASNVHDLASVSATAETIILGDFRYYAYFCNPLPLIRRAISILDSLEFQGIVIVAGRHANFFPTEWSSSAYSRSYKIYCCATIGELVRIMDLPATLAGDLGNDVLPCPGYAPTDLLLAGGLVGSVSQPKSGLVGQLLIHSGCRYRCLFCEKAGTPLLTLSAALLEQQLGEFKSADVTYVIIWDEVFGQDATAQQSILSSLRAAGMRFACNTRADLITEAFVDSVTDAGCTSILFGVEVDPEEAWASQMLQLDRGKRPGEAGFDKIVRLLDQRGVRSVASIVIGLPTDTQEVIQTRISRCASIGFSHVYARPLVPFPESALYCREVAAGRLQRYCDWPSDEFISYPRGYPVLSNLERSLLGQLAICRT